MNRQCKRKTFSDWENSQVEMEQWNFLTSHLTWEIVCSQPHVLHFWLNCFFLQELSHHFGCQTIAKSLQNLSASITLYKLPALSYYLNVVCYQLDNFIIQVLSSPHQQASSEEYVRLTLLRGNQLHSQKIVMPWCDDCGDIMWHWQQTPLPPPWCRHTEASALADHCPRLQNHRIKELEWIIKSI